MKYVGNTDAFCFGFYFMSLKWTETKIVIEITPLLQAYSCLALVKVGYGFLRISPDIFIEISLVLVVHSNENPFQHVLGFWFCYLGYENMKLLILVEVIWHV